MLGEKRKYQLVALLTFLNDNTFYNAKARGNSNTPCSCIRQIYFRASAEVKTRVPRIEATKSSLSLLLLDIGLKKILESGDFGLMVFTQALLRRSSSWKVKPKLGYVEY